RSDLGAGALRGPHRDRPASDVLQPEAKLHTDLEVGDLPVLDLAAHLSDLEPVEVAEGLRRPADAVADGGFDAVRRGADDVGHPVGAIGHWAAPCSRYP